MRFEDVKDVAFGVVGVAAVGGAWTLLRRRPVRERALGVAGLMWGVGLIFGALAAVRSAPYPRSVLSVASQVLVGAAIVTALVGFIWQQVLRGRRRC